MRTICREMSERFLRGGRLLAFGRGPYATDAQHVSVEFVHPVIVGKRALPALDLSVLFGPWIETLTRPDDMVMGFGPPEGDPEVRAALTAAAARGALTFALPGTDGSYAVAAATPQSVHAPGADRDPVPHALGDRPRLLRAPGARSRGRPGRVSLSVPRPREAVTGRPRRAGRVIDSDEGARRLRRFGRRWPAKKWSASPKPRSPSTSGCVAAAS